MNNRKYKKMGETGDIDASEIRRRASSGERAENLAPGAVSKGGSRRDRYLTPEDLFGKDVGRSVSAPGKRPAENKKRKAVKSTRKPAKKKTNKRPAENKKKPAQSNNGKTRYVIHENGNYNSKDTQRKKHSKKKKKLQRLRRLTAFVLITLAVIGLVTFVFIKTVFKIKEISIVYPSSQSKNIKRKYSNDKIIMASGTGEGKNLLVLNVEKTKNNIETKLPYLSVENVDKQGVGTLVLYVREVTPVYAYLSDNTYYLTDKSGKILENISSAENAGKYTIVKGIKAENTLTGEKIITSDEAHDGNKEKIKAVFDAIETSKIKKLTEIDFTKPDDVWMKYDGRIKIHLGKTDTAQAKMKLAVKTLEEEDKNSTVQTGILNLTVEKRAYFTSD